MLVNQVLEDDGQTAVLWNGCRKRYPLILSYYLSYIIREFRFYCDICHEEAHPSYWNYCCEDCRYFVRVRRARQIEKRLMSRLSLLLVSPLSQIKYGCEL